MAYCHIVENRQAGQEQFEQLKAHLSATGPFPPDGQMLLVAGPADPGWRVITVWESEEKLKRFYTERFPAACQAAGIDSVDSMERKIFEVRTLVAGDLVGARQLA
ncbi:MAG: hypothetical protein ACXVFQ_16060 [Solirubrobacteraceae bacterium]